MFDYVLRQDLRFFDRPENTVGALISRLDSYPQAILELMGFNVALILLGVINVVASSVLALIVSWKLAVVAVFALTAGAARAQDADPAESVVWQKVHESVFANAPIATSPPPWRGTISALSMT